MNLIFADVTFTRLTEMQVLNKDLWYVHSTVEGRRQPMTVPRAQMQAFVDFVEGRCEHVAYIDPSSFDLKKGQRVRIIDGVFAGREGTLVKVSGKYRKQIVVAIEGLLAVEITHANPLRIIEKI